MPRKKKRQSPQKHRNANCGENQGPDSGITSSGPASPLSKPAAEGIAEQEVLEGQLVKVEAAALKMEPTDPSLVTTVAQQGLNHADEASSQTEGERKHLGLSLEAPALELSEADEFVQQTPPLLEGKIYESPATSPGFSPLSIQQGFNMDDSGSESKTEKKVNDSTVGFFYQSPLKGHRKSFTSDSLTGGLDSSSRKSSLGSVGKKSSLDSVGKKESLRGAMQFFEIEPSSTPPPSSRDHATPDDNSVSGRERLLSGEEPTEEQIKAWARGDDAGIEEDVQVIHNPSKLFDDPAPVLSRGLLELQASPETEEAAAEIPTAPAAAPDAESETAAPEKSEVDQALPNLEQAQECEGTLLDTDSKDTVSEASPLEDAEPTEQQEDRLSVSPKEAEVEIEQSTNEVTPKIEIKTNEPVPMPTSFKTPPMKSTVAKTLMEDTHPEQPPLQQTELLGDVPALDTPTSNPEEASDLIKGLSKTNLEPPTSKTVQEPSPQLGTQDSTDVQNLNEVIPKKESATVDSAVDKNAVQNEESSEDGKSSSIPPSSEVSQLPQKERSEGVVDEASNPINLSPRNSKFETPELNDRDSSKEGLVLHNTSDGDLTKEKLVLNGPSNILGGAVQNKESAKVNEPSLPLHPGTSLPPKPETKEKVNEVSMTTAASIQQPTLEALQTKEGNSKEKELTRKDSSHLFVKSSSPPKSLTRKDSSHLFSSCVPPKDETSMFFSSAAFGGSNQNLQKESSAHLIDPKHYETSNKAMMKDSAETLFGAPSGGRSDFGQPSKPFTSKPSIPASNATEQSGVGGNPAATADAFSASATAGPLFQTGLAKPQSQSSAPGLSQDDTSLSSPPNLSGPPNAVSEHTAIPDQGKATAESTTLPQTQEITPSLPPEGEDQQAKDLPAPLQPPSVQDASSLFGTSDGQGGLNLGPGLSASTPSPPKSAATLFGGTPSPQRDGKKGRFPSQPVAAMPASDASALFGTLPKDGTDPFQAARPPAANLASLPPAPSAVSGPPMASGPPKAATELFGASTSSQGLFGAPPASPQPGSLPSRNSLSFDQPDSSCILQRSQRTTRAQTDSGGFGLPPQPSAVAPLKKKVSSAADLFGSASGAAPAADIFSGPARNSAADHFSAGLTSPAPPQPSRGAQTAADAFGKPPSEPQVEASTLFAQAQPPQQPSGADAFFGGAPSPAFQQPLPPAPQQPQPQPQLPSPFQQPPSAASQMFSQQPPALAPSLTTTGGSAEFGKNAPQPSTANNFFQQPVQDPFRTSPGFGPTHPAPVALSSAHSSPGLEPTANPAAVPPGQPVRTSPGFGPTHPAPVALSIPSAHSSPSLEPTATPAAVPPGQPVRTSQGLGPTPTAPFALQSHHSTPGLGPSATLAVPPGQPAASQALQKSQVQQPLPGPVQNKPPVHPAAQTPHNLFGGQPAAATVDVFSQPQAQQPLPGPNQIPQVQQPIPEPTQNQLSFSVKTAHDLFAGQPKKGANAFSQPPASRGGTALQQPITHKPTDPSNLFSSSASGGEAAGFFDSQIGIGHFSKSPAPASQMFDNPDQRTDNGDAHEIFSAPAPKQPSPEPTSGLPIPGAKKGQTSRSRLESDESSFATPQPSVWTPTPQFSTPTPNAPSPQPQPLPVASSHIPPSEQFPPPAFGALAQPSQPMHQKTDSGAADFFAQPNAPFPAPVDQPAPTAPLPTASVWNAQQPLNPVATSSQNQQNVMLGQVSSLPLQRKTPGIKPAAPLVSFGFGGRMMVMFPKPKLKLQSYTPSGVKIENENNEPKTYRKGPLQVYKLANAVCREDFLPDAEEFPGPLDKASPDSITQFIQKKLEQLDSLGRESEKLMWEVMQVFLECNGTLISETGPEDPKSPEARVMAILQQSLKKDTPIDHRLGRKSSTPANEPSEAALSTIEEHLVSGQRPKALEIALQHELWPLAMLISSMIDSATYQDVVRQYADMCLPHGAPLHTLALVFSGQAGGAVQHQGKSLHFAGNSQQQSILTQWKANLLAIIANRTAGWEKLADNLGDRLRDEMHDLMAAHTVYMIAGRSVQAPGPSSKLVLPGLDHRISLQASLRTASAVGSVHLLEIYDLALQRRKQTKKQQREQHTPSPVMGHKLRLAMLLAELGYLERADAYVKSIRGEVSGSGNSVEGKGPYTPMFLNALDIFEDRLCVCLGVPKYNPTTDAGSQSGSFFGKAFSKILGSAKPSPTATKEPIPTQTNYGQSGNEPLAMNNAGENHKRRREPSALFPGSNSLPTPAMPPAQLPFPAQQQFDQQQHQQRPQQQELNVSTAPQPFQSSPSPNSTNPLPKKKEKVEEAVNPPEPRKPPKKEKSAVKNAKQNKAMKKTKSGKGWGISTWIAKKMYPDAKQADIGDEMQAYFDDKLGVWVFPGEEDKAAEVAAGPPPPPTGPLDHSSAPSTEPGDGASSAPPSSSGASATAVDDPLAALMAPPPTSFRSSTGARSRYVDPFNPTPPSSQGSAVAPSSQGAKTPPMPKYAVFTPK